MTLTLGTKMVSLQEMFEPNCWVWEHPILAERVLKVANLKAASAKELRASVEVLQNAATGFRRIDRKIATAPEKNCLVVTRDGARYQGHIAGKRLVFVDAGKRAFSQNISAENKYNVEAVYTGDRRVIERSEFYNESIAELRRVWP